MIRNVLAIMLVAAGAARADFGDQIAKLTAADGAPGDRFGRSVAVSGDTAVVGRPWDTERGWASGSAYVFENIGGSWMQTAKLTADDAGEGDWFGSSVAICGDTIAVGAVLDDDRTLDCGSAYVFERIGGAWTQTGRLTADDGATGDYFGWSIGVSSDTIVVGAYGDDEPIYGPEAGAAYVFEKVGGTWSQAAKLIDSSAWREDWLGWSISVCGDTALVAGVAARGTFAGFACVFQREGGIGGPWVQAGKLRASDREPGDRFGESVCVRGRTSIIGAPGWDYGLKEDAGAAYIFERVGDAWAQSKRIRAHDYAYHDEFGYAVGMDGDSAVTCARLDRDNGIDSGSAYVFARAGGAWPEFGKLIATDGAERDEFGISVSVSGGFVVVGAVGDDDAGPESGSAYVFDVEICRVDLNSDGTVNSVDFVLFLSYFAAGDASADFNSDGNFDSLDFIAFLNAFVAGC